MKALHRVTTILSALAAMAAASLAGVALGLWRCGGPTWLLLAAPFLFLTSMVMIWISAKSHAAH